MKNDTKWILVILFALLTFCVALEAKAETCVCRAGPLNAQNFELSSECCRSALVWPGEVTGTNCFGPLCPMPDGWPDNLCNCLRESETEPCLNICEKRLVGAAMALRAEGEDITVIPERGLCFDQEFPFDSVGGEPFSELYLRVFEGSGGFEACNQDNALLHWEASWATLKQQDEQIDVLQAEIDYCYDRLDLCENPPPPPTPECSRIEDMVDGPGGSLWKPISESNGNPVVLMPGSYCQFVTMEMYNNSTLIERARLSNCSENGGRGHWRPGRRCEWYQDNTENLFLRFGAECRTVPDPCTRYD